jgi:hypothetical protein
MLRSIINAVALGAFFACVVGLLGMLLEPSQVGDMYRLGRWMALLGAGLSLGAVTFGFLVDVVARRGGRVRRDNS